MSTTKLKRETTSGSRKKTNATKPTETPAAPAAKKKEPAPFVQFFADQLAEMIIRGSNYDDLKAIVVAVATHQWRRNHDHMEDPDEREESLRRYADSALVDDWTGRLTVHWHERGLPSQPDDPEPATISERIRADRRGTLLRELNEFVQDATPEEILLLTEVVQDWNSITQRAPEDPEITIATALEEVLGRTSDHFLRVPYEQWDLTKQYLQLLKGRKIEEKKSAA